MFAEEKGASGFYKRILCLAVRFRAAISHSDRKENGFIAAVAKLFLTKNFNNDFWYPMCT